MIPRCLLTALCPLILSSCQLAQQWQEARKLDEQYTQYIERHQGESEALTALKKAAAEAALAQIRIIHASRGDLPDTVIPLSAEELSTVREIIPQLQDMPPLSRRAWDRMQADMQQMPLGPSFFTFTELEFQRENGDKINELSLTCGIGTCERAEAYRHRYTSLHTAPHYMLPAEVHKRFYSLPSVKKAEEE